MMERRITRQITVLLLYFADNAGLWMLELFFSTVHIKEQKTE